MSMLAPRWYADSPDRHGQGFSFRCPHCSERLIAMFNNPLDGSSPSVHAKVLYRRMGTSFETLTLSPMVLFFPSHGRLLLRGGQAHWEELPPPTGSDGS